MAINETIVTGRKFRKLVDETTKLWQRISFWPNASDVEFDDGETAQEKLGDLRFVSLTEEEYNALPVKDDNTIYFTTKDEE